MSIYRHYDSFELLYFLKLNTIKNNIDGFIYLFIFSQKDSRRFC